MENFFDDYIDNGCGLETRFVAGWAKNNRRNDLYNAKLHEKICGSLANPPPIRDFVNGGLIIEMP